MIVGSSGEKLGLGRSLAPRLGRGGFIGCGALLFHEDCLR